MFKQIKFFAHRPINTPSFDLIRLKSSNAEFPRHLLNVLDAYDIDCVIDVGANAGQYGKFLREIGFEGHIVSFEPVSVAFTLLEQQSAADEK